jgi:integrase
MATVGIYFDGRMAKEDENYVKYVVYHDGRQKYFTTGKKVDDTSVTFLKKYKGGLTGGVRDKALRNLWDMVYGETFTDEAGKSQRSLLPIAREIIARLGPHFSFDKFKTSLTKKEPVPEVAETNDLIADLKSKADALKLKEKLTDENLNRSTAQSLERFKGSSSLPYEEVTKEFLHGYEKWMLKKGKLHPGKGKNKKADGPASITTVGIYMRYIRELFNEKIESGFLPSSSYPFGRRGYTVPASKNIKKSLSIDQIGKIINYNPEPKSDEHKSRDFWLFSYLSNGLNIADILELKKSQIDHRNETIKFTREKTRETTKAENKPIQIDLNPITMQIIQTFGCKDPKKPYVFGYYDTKMTAIRKREVKSQLIKLINKHMAVIAETLEIPMDVTTYAARHSFATILLRSEAPLAFISQKLGHASISTTQNYLGSFEDDKVKKYLSALIPQKPEPDPNAH